MSQFQDPHVVAPYAVNDRRWFSFDDEESIKEKCDYVKKNGLGGGMIWSIDTDDFKGFCTGQKFPLLNMMAQV